MKLYEGLVNGSEKLSLIGLGYVGMPIAVAFARKLAPTMSPDEIIVVTISGRGDKDCAAIARYRGEGSKETS